MFLHRKSRKWSSSWNLGHRQSSEHFHCLLCLHLGLLKVFRDNLEVIFVFGHSLWFGGLCWREICGWGGFIIIKITEYNLKTSYYAGKSWQIVGWRITNDRYNAEYPGSVSVTSLDVLGLSQPMSFREHLPIEEIFLTLSKNLHFCQLCACVCVCAHMCCVSWQWHFRYI